VPLVGFQRGETPQTPTDDQYRRYIPKSAALLTKVNGVEGLLISEGESAADEQVRPWASRLRQGAHWGRGTPGRVGVRPGAGSVGWQLPS
jgi:hypothetical protein